MARGQFDSKSLQVLGPVSEHEDVPPSSVRVGDVGADLPGPILVSGYPSEDPGVRTGAEPVAPAVFYSGNHNLPAVMEALTAHLSWLWHVVLVRPGRESRIMGPHIHNGHWDLLVLTAGPYRPRRWLRDTLTSKQAAQDKALHPWQQAAEAPRYLVDRLCPQEGLVVDPCCGAGTFGAAALASGRRFLGVDADPTTLAIAADRLARAVPDAGPEDVGA
jgi:hypothetical protein